MQNKKGSQIVYDINEKVNQLNVNDKWVDEIRDISDNDLRLFNASISMFKELKLQDFQFKINNKILITSYFLWKIGKIDNNLCSYCIHLINFKEASGRFFFHFLDVFEKCIEYIRIFFMHFLEISKFW